MRIRPYYLVLAGFSLLFVAGCGSEGNTVVTPAEDETAIEDPGLEIVEPGGTGGKGGV